MAINHRTEHRFFGKDVGFRFDHQHRRLRTGNDEVKTAFLELRERRVEDVLVIDVTDAGRAQRAVEGDTGNRHGC